MLRRQLWKSLSRGAAHHRIARGLHATKINNDITRFNMPAMSPTMTEGTIAQWRKQVGDPVSAGDVLLEIETDKAQIEVEAADDGVLAKILADKGQRVAVGKPIALLAEEGDDIANIDVTKYITSDSTSTPSSSQPEPPKPEKPSSTRPSTAAASSPKAPKPLSPAVAHLISLHHIEDPSQIPTTGPNGRILKGDVLAFLGKIDKDAPKTVASFKTDPIPKDIQVAKKEPAPPQPTGPSASYTDVPLSKMRSVIAERLTAAKSTIPHSYVSREITVDAMLNLRQTLNNELGTKLSVNDFILKAAAKALRDVPKANVRFGKGGDLELLDEVDISVAVATPTGLITPIVKSADMNGLQDISRVIKELAERAKKGKLKPEEYQGGTFSISNLGMFGINHFSAIINPPQGCILAVGGVKQVVRAPDVVDITERENRAKEDIIGYLAGDYDTSTSTKSSPPKREELDVIDYLSGDNRSAKDESIDALVQALEKRIHPRLETSQVVQVQLSLDERVMDATVAGEFLDKLDFYVRNPENLLL
ncbi:uncharacterized protein VTP21DRAFT_2694 [Calcarisporiella thermophila]|uniref:uncharacterized protein n=1 Tax=Calcarisporiella thermophila TaxID=911321 RepID=UPI003744B1F4